MKYSLNFLNKTDYILPYIQENIELIIYSVICFFIPFFIGHPQLLVGTIVNASLILAALNLKNYKLLPIIILPSLAVLSRGLIFGPFTIFLIYMIPFIWLANSILILTFKKLNLQNNLNRWFTLFISAAAKTTFLFTTAFILVKIGILPLIFLTVMGIFQFYTAILGGILALSIHSIKKRMAVE